MEAISDNGSVTSEMTVVRMLANLFHDQPMAQSNLIYASIDAVSGTHPEISQAFQLQTLLFMVVQLQEIIGALLGFCSIVDPGSRRLKILEQPVPVYGFLIGCGTYIHFLAFLIFPAYLDPVIKIIITRLLPAVTGAQRCV